MKQSHRIPVASLALALMVLTAWWAYAPGLSGGFLFDDYANLPALGATGPVDDWATFWRYVTSGAADPTGRPLALLTFLLDARTWPADPRPFLETNLILHLVNGVLLALLLRQLGLLMFTHRGHGPFRQDPDSRVPAMAGGHARENPAQNAEPRNAKGQARDSTSDSPESRGSTASGAALRINLAAALGAGLWLLHPLFVSTTLYIVQREAMLPATFVLLGLLAWLHGRRQLLTRQSLSGLPWLALGLGGCTLLAVLSKGNGILLPALALVLEHTILRGHHTRRERPRGERVYRRAMLLLAWLPAALIAAYILHAGWSGMLHGISSTRPWTLGQRLLTEPRIMLDYLSLLWMPRPFTPGLFNDFIQVSTSPWHPITTMPALMAVLGLVAGALLARRRWPALAAAILFYFVGQSIESSTIALELFYEHRNYLPALLMFWPLALWLCGLPNSNRSKTGPAPDMASADDGPDARLPARERRPSTRFKPVSPRFAGSAKLLFAALLLVALALMTHARAGLWGNQRDQALLWAQLNPGSPRAQALAGQAEMAAGYPQLAVKRLQGALAAAPDEPQLAFNLMAAECSGGRIDERTIQAARKSLRSAIKTGSLLTHWFERNIAQAGNPPCPQMSPATLSSLLHAVEANPRLMAQAGRAEDVDYLFGLIALTRGDGETALLHFNAALDRQARISAALQQAALLGSHGFPELGLRHLDHYQAIASREVRPGTGMPLLHAWVLKKEDYWPRELKRLRHTLVDDAHRKAAVAPSSPTT